MEARIRFVPALAMLFTACAAAVNQDDTSDVTRVRADGILQSERGSVDAARTVSMRSYTILGTKTDVMAALEQAYEEHGIPIAHRDPPAGEIGNRQFRASGRLKGKPLSNYVTCPAISTVANLENVWIINLSVVTLVKPVNGGNVQLRTALQASARDPHSTTNPIRCDSRYNLEWSIAAAAAQKMGVRLVEGS